MQVLRSQGSLAFPAATPHRMAASPPRARAPPKVADCDQPLGSSGLSRGFTERWLGFDHIQRFSSAEPVDLTETARKRTAHASLTKACCLWPRPIACAVGSAFHPSAALLWREEVIPNLPSTVSIPALAFHSQEWPAWSQTRLAHVHILFCLGLREVFFFFTPLFTDEAVETQLGEMTWQVHGYGTQVFSPLSVGLFSLFHTVSVRLSRSDCSWSH